MSRVEVEGKVIFITYCRLRTLPICLILNLNLDIYKEGQQEDLTLYKDVNFLFYFGKYNLPELISIYTYIQITFFSIDI